MSWRTLSYVPLFGVVTLILAGSLAYYSIEYRYSTLNLDLPHHSELLIAIGDNTYYLAPGERFHVRHPNGTHTVTVSGDYLRDVVVFPLALKSFGGEVSLSKAMTDSGQQLREHARVHFRGLQDATVVISPEGISAPHALMAGDAENGLLIPPGPCTYDTTTPTGRLVHSGRFIAPPGSDLCVYVAQYRIESLLEETQTQASAVQQLATTLANNASKQQTLNAEARRREVEAQKLRRELESLKTRNSATRQSYSKIDNFLRGDGSVTYTTSHSKWRTDWRGRPYRHSWTESHSLELPKLRKEVIEPYE